MKKSHKLERELMGALLEAWDRYDRDYVIGAAHNEKATQAWEELRGQRKVSEALVKDNQALRLEVERLLAIIGGLVDQAVKEVDDGLQSLP